ncbi:MAG: hypothetical protein M4579_005564 [Chaenotheca gracillima]|nr:MAG: hypothetical protein M4579_005564 [Chaenotheca gracillima]
MSEPSSSQGGPQDLTSLAVDRAVASNTDNTNASPSPSPADLDASKTTIELTTKPRSVPLPNAPEIASVTTATDHMITVHWTSESGWSAPKLKPYGPLSLMPTASVLHYATECFEGTKAYRGHDGQLRLFRPSRNTARMLISATRIALPGFNPDELEKLIKLLVSVDGPKWLPRSAPGTFLYLRPTMIATDPGLSLHTPLEALLYIILCPFPSTLKASTPTKPGLRLLASREDSIRAWPGGLGFAKVGANYGPSVLAQGEARQRGYDAVLWLFGPDALVTEAGTSNFFVVWRKKGEAGETSCLELVTAPLGDKVILDGVTRGSVLELARERLVSPNAPGHVECLRIVERSFTMKEVEDASQEGRLVEAFVAGTAYFITPVSEIHFRGTTIEVPVAREGDKDQSMGPYARLFRTWLEEIIYGRKAHKWGVVVDEAPGAVNK